MQSFRVAILNSCDENVSYHNAAQFFMTVVTAFRTEW